MTHEEHPQSPPAVKGKESNQPSGLEIAMQWAQLPSEHLQSALKALEPQLRREHELQMERERAANEISVERMRLEARQSDSKRSHLLYLLGLIAGFILAAGMLVGAVIVATDGQAALATLFAGPSLIALVSIFVLRRKDASDTQALQQSQQHVLQTLQQAGPQV